MKAILFLMPTIPVTMLERAERRPVAVKVAYFQKMLREVTELARIAEDLGFNAISTTEHHLHSEGLELGGTAAFHAHIAANTRHIRVGPTGYVLPAWNPLRLATEIGWLDQLTNGRAIVGLARGYQTRWFNMMTQRMGIDARGGTRTEREELSRMIFEEVFAFLKLAWRDEPFDFKGKFWQYPFPYDEGTPWPAADWTEKYGSPGEVENGVVRKINPVPKTVQKPHPECFLGFTTSDSSIKWAGRNEVSTIISITDLEGFRKRARAYRAAAAEVGIELPMGRHIGVVRQVVIGRSREEAMQIAEHTPGTVFNRDFSAGFGFWEGLRLPGDEEKWPLGKVPLPRSEWTVERMAKTGQLVAGSLNDIRRSMDELVEAVDLEYFQIGTTHGMLPFDEAVRQLRLFGEGVLPHYR
jgi:alkanesulfonate monooxygenase SsuD/methylene tetrahydromethanopterin reductase-like flavin-dependent oxidoreductase (luciferase family)